jgi:hypothetical protein
MSLPAEVRLFEAVRGEKVFMEHTLSAKLRMVAAFAFALVPGPLWAKQDAAGPDRAAT